MRFATHPFSEAQGGGVILVRQIIVAGDTAPHRLDWTL